MDTLDFDDKFRLSPTGQAKFDRIVEDGVKNANKNC